MDYTDHSARKEVLELLKQVVAARLHSYEQKLIPLLTQDERGIYAILQKVTFADGAWYRPIHNVIVTLSALALCAHEDVDRDVIVPCAMLHDIGNSLITVEEGKGPSWQGKDKRILHSELGAKKAREVLELQSWPADKIDLICKMILTHDNPYMGLPLNSLIERQHRDCDRCFVPSVVSYYKDFFNYLDDSENEFRKNLTPSQFYSMRCSGFFESHDTFPTDDSLAGHNESECEPQTTVLGEQIITSFLQSRGEERGWFELHSKELIDKIGLQLDSEIDYLCSFLSENSNQ